MFIKIINYILKIRLIKILIIMLPVIIVVIGAFYLLVTHNIFGILIILITIVSVLMSLHAILTIVGMLYVWDAPSKNNLYNSPKVYKKPLYSFSALIPAHHEKRVIKDTIRAINNIDYPHHLKEIITICHESDTETIKKIRQVIEELKNDNIKLTIFSGDLINKPRALNLGFTYSINDITVIFDAEDEPHKDLYKIVNTLFIDHKPDVIQSGIQLMDINSHWYSVLNVLEYFFWFKSVLHFFARNGFIALGGNTVFFKKRILQNIKGWNENSLTEDADIGLRLSCFGAKTMVIYDEEHVTREETPHSISGFIKQRSRWRQGFMQIFINGDWKKLPDVKEKVLAGYVFASPFIELIMVLYIPVAINIILFEKLPVFISILTFIPLYLMVLQVLIFIIGSWEFCKNYKLKYSYFTPLKIIITYLPFQVLLFISILRASYRLLKGNNSWEKTLHLNSHRSLQPIIEFSK